MCLCALPALLATAWQKTDASSVASVAMHAEPLTGAYLQAHVDAPPLFRWSGDSKPVEGCRTAARPVPGSKASGMCIFLLHPRAVEANSALTIWHAGVAQG